MIIEAVLRPSVPDLRHDGTVTVPKVSGLIPILAHLPHVKSNTGDNDVVVVGILN